MDWVPLESCFEPRSPRYGLFLIWGCVWCTDSGALGGLFEVFLGHIVDLEGTKGLFDTRKSSRSCTIATVSLCLAVLKEFSAVLGQKLLFWAKRGCFWLKKPRSALGACILGCHW